jgi:putative phosphoribosyl transferase
MNNELRRQHIRIAPVGMEGVLDVPPGAIGLVIFAHGSGSGRLSPRNQQVADGLGLLRFATLLVDLLTPSEVSERRNVFDIGMLGVRFADVAAWAGRNLVTATLPLGFFGASTGAGAAMLAATRVKPAAIVSCAGRPDLAGPAVLAQVEAPTLLIVGSLDATLLELNRQALAQLAGPKELVIVPGAGRLFEEPGTLDEVVRLASGWFERFLPTAQRATPRKSS